MGEPVSYNKSQVDAKDALRLAKASNLSDLANAATARTNLGLGTASTANASSFAAVSNNLSDLASAATSRTNLGVGYASAGERNTFRNNIALGSTSSVAFASLSLSTSLAVASTNFTVNASGDTAIAGTLLVTGTTSLTDTDIDGFPITAPGGTTLALGGDVDIDGDATADTLTLSGAITLGTASPNAKFINIATGHDYGDFCLGGYTFLNAGSAITDYVMTLGWINTNEAGAYTNPLKPGFSDRLEAAWDTAGDGTALQFERHIAQWVPAAYISGASTPFDLRTLSINSRVDGKHVTTYLSVDTLYYQHPITGTVLYQADATHDGLTGRLTTDGLDHKYYGNSSHRFKKNNLTYLYGRNAADNADVAVLGFNSSNVIVIGSAGNGTSFGGAVTGASSASFASSVTGATLTSGGAISGGALAVTTGSFSGAVTGGSTASFSGSVSSGAGMTGAGALTFANATASSQIGGTTFSGTTITTTGGGTLNLDGGSVTLAATITSSTFKNGATISGSDNVLRQSANGNDVITLRRFTDTSPTGYFERFQNAAGTDVATTAVNGDRTARALTLTNTLTVGVSTNTTANGTITPDLSAAQVFKYTLTGNLTLANPTNPVDGQMYRWLMKQDGTGSRTLTLGSKFDVSQDSASAINATASKWSVVCALYDSTLDKYLTTITRQA